MDANYLPEFQRFLRSNQLVRRDRTGFYAFWVSRFLSFANKKSETPPNLVLPVFLDTLRSDPKIEDWQVDQAKEAISLYSERFLAQHKPTGCPAPQAPDPGPSGSIPVTQIRDWIQQVREAIRVLHYSYRTERTYITWIKDFFGYIQRTRTASLEAEPPSSDDVKNYLTYLALRRKVASSTQNQALNALVFFFKRILRKQINDLAGTIRAKRGAKLPVVLAKEEVETIFKCMSGKSLLMLKLLYGAGLRVNELVRLRVQDLDFANNLLFVRSGKGDKDRTTFLPGSLHQELQTHLAKVQKTHETDLAAGHGQVFLPGQLSRKYPNAAIEWKWQYVFPAGGLSVDPRSGTIRRHHVSDKSIQNAMRKAVKKTGIPKHATVHTLRHSFATHLLMAGTHIREIQELLGHKNVETTMIYTHVVRELSTSAESPLDHLQAGPAPRKAVTL